MEDEVDLFLAHYGVKGMKWGRHNPVDPRTQRIRQARSELYKKSFAGYKDHKVGASVGAVGATIMVGRWASRNLLNPAHKNAAIAVIAGTHVASIPMIHAQGYSKGKSAVLGLLGGPISLVVVTELNARRQADSTSKK